MQIFQFFITRHLILKLPIQQFVPGSGIQSNLNSRGYPPKILYMSEMIKNILCADKLKYTAIIQGTRGVDVKFLSQCRL